MKINACILVFVLSAFSAYSQRKIEPYVGVHVSMDAGAYFIAPSFMLGADYPLIEKVSVSSYFHGFWDRLYAEYPDGSFDKGKYQSYILAFLLQLHLSRSAERGMYIAAGAAVQRTITDYFINYITYDESWTEARTIPVAAMRVGYKWPIKQRALAVELNALGPHKSEVGPPPYYSQEIEILTQLSLGCRFIF